MNGFSLLITLLAFIVILLLVFVGNLGSFCVELELIELSHCFVLVILLSCCTHGKRRGLIEVLLRWIRSIRC